MNWKPEWIIILFIFNSFSQTLRYYFVCGAGYFKCSFKSLSVRWPTTACITTAISSTVVTRAPDQTLHNNITWYCHTKCKTSFSCQRVQTESELSVTFAWRLLVFWTAAHGTCFSFLAVRFDKKLWTRHQDGSWQEREGVERKREKETEHSASLRDL